MKLKDIKIDYSKFHAYLKNEGKNETCYHDTMKFKIIKGVIEINVTKTEDIPVEYLECEVVDFDVEIVLNQHTGRTQYKNKYRAQQKQITLWIV